MPLSKDSRPLPQTTLAEKGMTYGLAKTALFMAFFAVYALPLITEAAFFPAIPLIFDKPKTVYLSEKPLNLQNMQLLQAAVNVDPNPAKGGGEITIVGGTALLAENGPSGTILDVEEREVNPDHISVYVVREGDTLAEIAKLFGVSVNTVVWANDIKNRSVKVGDTLIILPVSGVQHTVVKGDTLASIAKKYKADLSEIAQFNEISENAKLVAGDTLMIPDGEVSAPKVVSGSSKPVIRGGGPSYAGYYTRPIVGGRRSQGIHGYNGVDLVSTYGASVYAAAAGEVIVSRNYGYNGGYGNYIVIRHSNNTQTLYAHLSNNVVFQGARVEQGQLIGTIGNTGKSTGPHLHFEVRGATNPF